MGVVIGVLVVAVVVLIGVMSMTGGGGASSNNAPAAAKKTSEPAPTPAPATFEKTADTPAPAAKGGKEPTRQAPNLTVAVIDKADAFYSKAKQLNDEARKVQATGNNKDFNRLVNESWSTLEELNGFIATYTDWLAEADLEGWRIPAEYVRLQQRLTVYDRLQGRLRRVKANLQK